MKKKLSFFVIIFVLVISLIVYKLLNTAKNEIVTYKTNNGQDIYFYIDEIKYEYNSKITISSENEIIKLSTDNYEHDFNSEPIYFKNKKKVLFPHTMSVVFTKDNYIQNKIDKYTTIELNGSYYIKNKNLNYVINDAFLYDLNNTYFFLNETKIKINDIEYTLPPFSYVIYNYNKELYMYNYEEDKIYYFNDINNDIKAFNNDYTINLAFDSITYKDGQKLLMKNIDFLNKLK